MSSGLVARMGDNRWTIRYTMDNIRKCERPNTKWEDPINSSIGPTWKRLAQDREMEALHLLHWRDHCLKYRIHQVGWRVLKVVP